MPEDDKKTKPGASWPFSTRPGDLHPMHPDLATEIRAVQAKLMKIDGAVAAKFAMQIQHILDRWCENSDGKEDD